jgi:hypothetical protein
MWKDMKSPPSSVKTDFKEGTTGLEDIGIR